MKKQENVPKNSGDNTTSTLETCVDLPHDFMIHPAGVGDKQDVNLGAEESIKAGGRWVFEGKITGSGTFTW